MAEAQGGNPGDGKSQPPANDGDKSKLFFGKYKSIEEAEQGYKELERGFHSKAQEAKQWKEIADRGTYVPTSTPANAPAATPPADATNELTEFYANPAGWRKKIVSQTKEELRREQEENARQASETATRINEWGKRNPDLAKHGVLLETYVRRTDPRLSIESRLDQAAEETRAYLNELRGQGRTSQPDPNVADGDPGSSRESAPAGGSGSSAPQPTSDESQLAAYAQERNRSRMKRPGTHRS